MRACQSAVMIVAAVALLALPVGASVFNADFEAGYTSGPLPTGPLSPVGLYPDIGTGLFGKPAGQSPNWNANGWSSDPNEPNDTWPPNDAFVTVDPANPNNHVAAFVGDSSGGPVRPSSIGSKMTLNTANDITFSQKAYYPSVMNTGEHRVLVINFLPIGLYFGTSGYFGDGQLGWTLDANGWNIAHVTPDAWHEAVVTVHLAAGTVDFSVDGAPIVTGKAVNLGSFAGPAKYNAYSDNTNVNFGAGGNDYGAIFLDDVQVSQVPEPLSLGLLALGGAALLRRQGR